MIEIINDFYIKIYNIIVEIEYKQNLYKFKYSEVYK